MSKKRRFPECRWIQRRAKWGQNSGLGRRVIFSYSKIVTRYLNTFGQVLIAVISDVFDRLQERRESAWIKGQASLTREVELVFGTYPCGIFSCTFGDHLSCRFPHWRHDLASAGLPELVGFAQWLMFERVGNSRIRLDETH